MSNLLELCNGLLLICMAWLVGGGVLDGLRLSIKEPYEACSL